MERRGESRQGSVRTEKRRSNVEKENEGPGSSNKGEKEEKERRQEGA